MTAPRVAVGFDVGGTHLRACVLWPCADGSDTAPTARPERLAHGAMVRARWNGTGRASVQELAETLERVGLEAIAATPEVLHAEDAASLWSRAELGVGIAAQLDRTGALVRNAPNLGWRDLPLAAELEHRLGRAPLLTNDVNAILLGELQFGPHGDRSRQGPALAVYMGTGIGGALALDGALVTGAGGNAGEVGHAKVPGSTAQCGCGEVGCLEAVAGGRALLARFATDAEAGLVSWAGDVRGAIGPGHVDERAARGDAYAQATWAWVSEAVGHVLSGLCTALNPSLLVLGGGVLHRAPHLRALIEERELWL